MKIKLTEEQYNRLLVENDKDFLDGKVEFPHIGNKVNKFIVKLFNYIYEKKGRYTSSKERDIREIIDMYIDKHEMLKEFEDELEKHRSKITPGQVGEA